MSYSLFIPRVFTNITKERITDVFRSLEIGEVVRVDLVCKQSHNGDYNSVYIYMNGFDTIASRNFISRVEETGKQGVKLVYDEPWYWIVLKNLSPKPENNNSNNGARKQTIVIDEEAQIRFETNQGFIQGFIPDQGFIPLPDPLVVDPVVVPVVVPDKMTDEDYAICDKYFSREQDDEDWIMFLHWKECDSLIRQNRMCRGRLMDAGISVEKEMYDFNHLTRVEDFGEFYDCLYYENSFLRKTLLSISSQ